MTGGQGTASQLKLGINGFGRVGKLTLWHHVARKYFSEIVVNIGRDVGKSFKDLADYVAHDSTYGPLRTFLHGHRSGPVIGEISESRGTMFVDGVPVRFLFESRNPAEIAWPDSGVRLVIDATGKFLDPTKPADSPGGSCLGHLEAGAEKVLVTAPFKIKDNTKSMPGYAITTVMGINDGDYDPARHKIVSNASCTTTCLAHTIKPLLDNLGPDRILTALMTTIHAVTPTQPILDRMPSAGAGDLRKNRAAINNIILTSTGAAKALGLVMPEINNIAFLAESVRVPTLTGSLIILVMALLDDHNGNEITAENLNEIYRRAASDDQNGYLLFSERQNVSADIVGQPRAAAIIEGSETYAAPTNAAVDMSVLCSASPELAKQLNGQKVRAPVSEAVIHSWYDNEYASFVNMLGDRAESMARLMKA